MRVRDCQKCKYYRDFITREYRGYDRKEVRHHYGWCHKYKKRCTDICRCDVPAVKAGQTIMDGVQAKMIGRTKRAGRAIWEGAGA